MPALAQSGECERFHRPRRCFRSPRRSLYRTMRLSSILENLLPRAAPPWRPTCPGLHRCLCSEFLFHWHKISLLLLCLIQFETSSLLLASSTEKRTGKPKRCQATPGNYLSPKSFSPIDRLYALNFSSVNRFVLPTRCYRFLPVFCSLSALIRRYSRPNPGRYQAPR